MGNGTFTGKTKKKNDEVDGCHFAPFPKLIPNEANASFNGKTDLCS
jgi:hypothetical protein|tara:strand:+ start:364 stop:501 length:138 start_codon:yes stop_codon:yes gene_type:complete